MRNEFKEKRRSRFSEKWYRLLQGRGRSRVIYNIDAKIAVYVNVGACKWIQMWYSRKAELKESELTNIMSALLSKGYLTKA